MANFWPADDHTIDRGITPKGRHWITGAIPRDEGGFFIAVHDPTTPDEENRYFRAEVMTRAELDKLVKKYVTRDSADGLEELPPPPDDIPIVESTDGR